MPQQDIRWVEGNLLPTVGIADSGDVWATVRGNHGCHEGCQGSWDWGGLKTAPDRRMWSQLVHYKLITVVVRVEIGRTLWSEILSSLCEPQWCVQLAYCCKKGWLVQGSGSTDRAGQGV